MRLGLHDDHKPFEDDRGVIRIDGRRLRVVDLDTGAEVENIAAMLWGPGSILTAKIEGEEEGLLTPEHVDESRDYLVVVVPCEAAIRF